MGTQVSKIPNARCSTDGCNMLCCDSHGRRVVKPHKARCCSVCSKWYCGFHKNIELTQRRKIVGKSSYYVYKCTTECVGKARTSKNVRS